MIDFFLRFTFPTFLLKGVSSPLPRHLVSPPFSIYMFPYYFALLLYDPRLRVDGRLKECLLPPLALELLLLTRLFFPSSCWGPPIRWGLQFFFLLGFSGGFSPNLGHLFSFPFFSKSILFWKIPASDFPRFGGPPNKDLFLSIIYISPFGFRLLRR